MIFGTTQGRDARLLPRTWYRVYICIPIVDCLSLLTGVHYHLLACALDSASGLSAVPTVVTGSCYRTNRWPLVERLLVSAPLVDTPTLKTFPLDAFYRVRGLGNI
jgi:hypothetical protein